MKPLARILPLATLAALPVAAALAAPQTIWVTNCHKVAYRPKSLSLSCGDANNVLEGLKWSGWNNLEARGAGTNLVNPCRPNCASSRAEPYVVQVMLSHPKACENVGRKVFDRITLTYGRRKPGPHKTVTDTLGCPLTG